MTLEDVVRLLMPAGERAMKFTSHFGVPKEGPNSNQRGRHPCAHGGWQEEWLVTDRKIRTRRRYEEH